MGNINIKLMILPSSAFIIKLLVAEYFMSSRFLQSIMLILLWDGQFSRYSHWLRAVRSEGRIPVGGDSFRTCPAGPGDHPVSCTVGTGSLPGVESCRGVMLTPHPLLVPRSKIRVELYLYSPYGPSWPVKRVKLVLICYVSTFGFYSLIEGTM
jgi:hypothetical protein